MGAVDHAPRPSSPGEQRAPAPAPPELRPANVSHLYVHLPFCAHRCGYCDFVTVVGRAEEHDRYVDALLAELELERELLARPLETLYLGGGTPTLTRTGALLRLLASLPPAAEVTVEANPETVTSPLARALRDGGVTRVSLGAQSFRPDLLATLGRRAGAADVRRAVYALRDASFDNISLDLLYGIPGQSAADLDADLAQALALEPEHLSCYELEAKPGTRFTHRHGAELGAQAEALEGYFEHVVSRLTAAGYRWYETANFCRAPSVAGGRDLRARHNLAYWRGRDYVGLGIGAVSTVGTRRWRNRPSLRAYVGALLRGARPAREFEELPGPVRERERVLLGLRLDEPLALAGLERAFDAAGLARAERLGLVEHRPGTVALTRRGRFVGGAVTADVVA
ncbi:MAG: radical SAM family heme chaperone HemW [Thermoleophilia bacterium]|nr:radical SAM family heme chaperone HemW [Thermoleophilia bacterium]